MAEKSDRMLALNLLSFDGGGITGLSSLLILREIMIRLQRKSGSSKRPDPWEHFDLIAGTGTGAICAVMVGRLRMSVDDAIKAYAYLALTVFSDKKLIVHGGSGAFRATKLEQGLKTIVEKATGDAEERMMEESPNKIKCKVVIYAMSAHNMNAGLPCAFRTYPANANAMPDCAIWKALRASTAHPELFKSIEIGELGVGQHYIGGGLGCNNPTAQMLKEAATLYPDRPVGSVVSIGTGHARTIQIPQPSWYEPLLPVGTLTIPRALKVAHDIATDNERVAEEMAARFSDSEGIYYRLNVDQGMQSIEPSEWDSQNEVTGHTIAYMQKTEANRLLDDIVASVYERRCATKTQHIDGRATISPSSLPIPSSHCPLPTSLFTGRIDEVDMVRRYFANDEPAQQVFVLHGLGGAGKTQTALKSVELMVSRFEGVIFIDGSSRENVETALSGFAASRHLGKAYLDALNWIGSRKKRWLMLFDNVDDPDVRVHEYFPRSARDKDARCNISELASEDARRLLLEAAGLDADGLQDSENAAAVILLEELGNLALAIVQSGAYIRRTRCSMAQYHEIYLVEHQEILTGDGMTSLKVEGYDRSLHATWGLSYKRLGETSKRLLGLAAFLHRDRISEHIFRRASVNMPKYQPAIPPTNTELNAQRDIKELLGLFLNKKGDWSSRLFLLAMGDLVSLSLLTFDTTLHVYRFHPLVQQWARSLAPDMPTAIERTAFLLAVSIDRGKRSEDGAFKRAMISHVNEIIKLHPIPNANNAWQFVLVFDELKDPNGIEKLELQVLEARIRALGKDHPDTLESMACVAGTHFDRGRLAEAEALLVEVLAARKRLLGDDHPDTLDSMVGLAAVYLDRDQLAKAETTCAEVLAARTRVLGHDHPDTLGSMAGLAVTYGQQGRLAEAEALHTEVLAARKRLLGDEHPDTLWSIAELAAAYLAQGRLAQAQTSCVEVLATRNQVLGKDHPYTLWSMGDLAVTYRRQGRLAEAEVLDAEALAASKRVLGDDHPETLGSMTRLAWTYFKQGRLAEAEALHAEALAARKRVLGDDHPSTLGSMAGLAATYHTQGRLAKAEALHAEVLAARKRVLGDNHPDTLWSMKELAVSYLAQGRLAEAELSHVEVLAARKRVLGNDHPDTLGGMAGLALAYLKQGRLAEAEALYSEALAARKRVLGDEHPDTLEGMAGLAATYRKQGRLAEAEALHVEALAARKRILRDDHPDTLGSMVSLAVTYHKQGRLAEAEALHAEALVVQKRVLGEGHPNTLWNMGALAGVYLDQGRLAEAEASHIEVLDARKRVLENDHPDRLWSMGELAVTYRKQGRLSEAEALHVEVLATRKRLLGDDHPDTLKAMRHLAWTYDAQNRHAEYQSLTSQIDVILGCRR